MDSQRLLGSVVRLAVLGFFLVACSAEPSSPAAPLQKPNGWVVSANDANNLRVALPPDLNVLTDQWRISGEHWTDGPIRVWVFVAGPGDHVGQPTGTSRAAVIAWLEAQNGSYVTQQSRALRLPAGEAIEVIATFSDAPDNGATVVSYAIATLRGFVWVQIDASSEEWERRGESLRLIPYFVEIGPPR